jgi:hypothetical protein
MYQTSRPISPISQLNGHFRLFFSSLILLLFGCLSGYDRLRLLSDFLYGEVGIFFSFRNSAHAKKIKNAKTNEKA